MTNSLFPVVILAGGLATRLHPLTETTPKSLISINGEPFINHQLRLLQNQGVNKVVICVGYLSEMIKDHIGDGSAFGLDVQYSYDGEILRGTGGAIKQSLSLLENEFFVLYGDSYLNCDYRSIQTAFQNQKKAALMTVLHNANQWDASNIEYHDGQILAYSKQERTNRMQYIDYGIGILTKNILMRVPDHEPYDLALLYQSALQENQLAAYEVNTRFYETGSFTGIKELEYHLSSL